MKKIFSLHNNHEIKSLVVMMSQRKVYYNYYINRPSFRYVSPSFIAFFRFLFLHFLAFFSFDSEDKKARHDAMTEKVRVVL